MMIIPLCWFLALCRATFFFCKTGETQNKLKVSLIALEMLQIGGVIKHPWEVELANRLSFHGLGLGDAILPGSGLDERQLYFRALARSGQFPSSRVVIQMRDTERALFPLSHLWHPVAQEKDLTLRAGLVRKLLNLTRSEEDLVTISRFCKGFDFNLSVRGICLGMWQYPRPFTGGHLPEGPFANILRQFTDLPEEEIQRGLPRFESHVMIQAEISNSSQIPIETQEIAIPEEIQETSNKPLRGMKRGCDDSFQERQTKRRRFFDSESDSEED